MSDLDRDRLREDIDIFEVQRGDKMYPGERRIVAAARAVLNATEIQWCAEHRQTGIRKKDHCQWTQLADAVEFSVPNWRTADCRMVSALLLIPGES